MPDPFDGFLYFSHLRSRWRVPVILGAAALLCSLVFSLLVTKQYRASVTLIIEPPAGSDPRSAIVVSPIYLESLRTYEHFASSDELFARAIERFQLRRDQPGRSLESWKRAVLKVTVPRNTKILEIEATLPDPRKAHELARFVAEETIELNRRTGRAGDDALIAEARRRLDDATRRQASAEADKRQAAGRTPTPDSLRSELEQLSAAREEVQRFLISTELSGSESAPARLATLRRQSTDLERQIQTRYEKLAQRTSEVDAANVAYDSAWTAREEIERRFRELQAAAGTRTESLNIVNPGVVPERPASPNIPLNLLVALGVSLVASLFILTIEFGWRSSRPGPVREPFRIVAKN